MIQIVRFYFLLIIQEGIGVLSERSNIICISDEAHRTQTGVGAKLKKTNKGLYTTYGFAEYLRRSFPNATYCGFTGTPIDEAIAVFGDIVDSYTMKEASDDGITVRIAYEPRLVRVILSEDDAKEIQKYYNRCAEQGANEEQIEESKRGYLASYNKRSIDFNGREVCERSIYSVCKRFGERSGEFVLDDA